MNGREKNELITVRHKMKVWTRKWHLAKDGMLGSHIVGKMGSVMTKMDILKKSNCYGRTHVSGNNSSAQSVSKVCRKLELWLSRL